MKRWVERSLVVCAIGAIALALMCLDHGAPDSSIGFAPPALSPAGRDRKLDLNQFLAQTEKVEVALASGEKLRGVFVPSDPGAPVVVHLLESGASVVGVRDLFGVTRCAFTDLSGLGFASLALDYRGIGASDGERSVDHLADDAWEMWREAVRRAGGREDLVVIRATSIGTIAAALVLARGAQPGAIVLFDPVESESVAVRFASAEYGFAAGWLAQAIFRPVANVDVKATLARVTAPMLVISPEHEALLSNHQRMKLRSAVETANGHWVERMNGVANPDTIFGHACVATESHESIQAEELTFLRSSFADWPDAIARREALLAQVDDEARRALAGDSAAMARFVRNAVDGAGIPAHALAAMAVLGWTSDRTQEFAIDFDPGAFNSPWKNASSFDDWRLLLDARDGAGDLPCDYLTVEFRWRKKRLPLRHSPRLDAIEEVLAVVRIGESSDSSSPFDALLYRPAHRGSSSGQRAEDAWRELVLDRHLGRADARRQLARMLLKGAGLPDRVVADERGSHLEAKECGEWKRVDLEWPEPKASPADPSARASER